MGADITIIGISASACILESAASLIGHGYLCRVLADGILNHYPDQCQGPWEYREVNGLAMVMEDYARHPELLDMSGIGDCRNLMDFHRDAMKAYPH